MKLSGLKIGDKKEEGKEEKKEKIANIRRMKKTE
jgi:hypothetical protein